MAVNSINSTNASFIFASLQELFFLWRAGKKGSLTVECEDGKLSQTFSHGFSCHLEKPHCRKKKSANRQQRLLQPHQLLFHLPHNQQPVLFDSMLGLLSAQLCSLRCFSNEMNEAITMWVVSQQNWEEAACWKNCRNYLTSSPLQIKLKLLWFADFKKNITPSFLSPWTLRKWTDWRGKLLPLTN